jgi:hypothetical protein
MADYPSVENRGFAGNMTAPVCQLCARFRGAVYLQDQPIVADSPLAKILNCQRVPC